MTGNASACVVCVKSQSNKAKRLEFSASNHARYLINGLTGSVCFFWQSRLESQV